MRPSLLVILVAASCSKDPEPSPPRPKNTEASAKAPTDAAPAPAAKPSVPPPAVALALGGERIKARDNAAENPLEAYLPAAEAIAAVDATALGSLDRAFERATGDARDGKTREALALLYRIVTLESCPSCPELVMKVTRNTDWQRLWGTRELAAVLSAWSPADAPPEDWWEEGKAGCPPGTKRAGKLNEDGEGEVYCRKPGGARHGPYHKLETGIDMGEGSLTIDGTYQDGKPHGLWSHNESFAPSTAIHYLRGQPVGVARSEHQEEETFTIEFADRSLEWMVDGDSNVLRWGESRGNKAHGPQLRWDVADGFCTLVERKGYERGKLHGEAIDYHPSTGQPAKLVTYDHGVAHGPVKYWDASGKLLAETTMDHGNGDWIEYNGDKLVAKGTFKDGKKEGEWIEDDGDSRGRYEGGVRVGPWVASTFKYPKTEGEYKAGKRNGLWTYYKGNGDELGAKGHCVADKPDGEWIVVDVMNKETKLGFQRGKLTSIAGDHHNPFAAGFDTREFCENPSVPDLDGP